VEWDPNQEGRVENFSYAFKWVLRARLLAHLLVLMSLGLHSKVHVQHGKEALCVDGFEPA